MYMCVCVCVCVCVYIYIYIYIYWKCVIPVLCVFENWKVYVVKHNYVN
jgi:hypothetical protein